METITGGFNFEMRGGIYRRDYYGLPNTAGWLCHDFKGDEYGDAALFQTREEAEEWTHQRRDKFIEETKDCRASDGGLTSWQLDHLPFFTLVNDGWQEVADGQH